MGTYDTTLFNAEEARFWNYFDAAHTYDDDMRDARNKKQIADMNARNTYDASLAFAYAEEQRGKASAAVDGTTYKSVYSDQVKTAVKVYSGGLNSARTTYIDEAQFAVSQYVSSAKIADSVYKNASTAAKDTFMTSVTTAFGTYSDDYNRLTGLFNEAVASISAGGMVVPGQFQKSSPSPAYAKQWGGDGDTEIAGPPSWWHAPLYGFSGTGQLLWSPFRVSGVTWLFGIEDRLKRSDIARKQMHYMLWGDNPDTIGKLLDVGTDIANGVTAAVIIIGVTTDKETLNKPLWEGQLPGDDVKQGVIDAAEETRQRALGWDPDAGKFRSNELQGVLRLEEYLGVQVERLPKGVGGDFIGPDGTVYDLVGPLPTEHFKLSDILQSINRHLRKSINKTVVDFTGLTSDQKAAILYNIMNIDSAKIILIGL